MSNKIDSPFCTCSQCVPASLTMRTLKRFGQTIIGLLIMIAVMVFFGLLISAALWTYDRAPSVIYVAAILSMIGLVVGAIGWAHDLGKGIWRDR